MSSSVAQAVLDNRIAASLRILELIEKLADFGNLPGTTIDLMRRGSAGTSLLADALLFGKPSCKPQSRSCLVSALATLGETDILLRYLRNDRRIDDPQVRLAEDIVISAAARAMMLNFGVQTYWALLDIARKRSVPGVLEALAMYRRPESIPCFIQAIGDDCCRSIAIQSLRSFGDRAIRVLSGEALRSQPQGAGESASGLQRRRGCLQALASSRLRRSDCAALLDLLFDEDLEIVLQVGTILVASGDKEQHRSAVRRLKAIRPHMDRSRRGDLDILLAQLEDKGKSK